MTEAAAKIPEDLRESFSGAIAQFRSWDRGGDEPTVSLSYGVRPISVVCELVWSFADEMPDGDYENLCDEADKLLQGSRGYSYRGELPHRPKSHSYASGAQCLKRLIDFRKAWYARER